MKHFLQMTFVMTIAATPILLGPPSPMNAIAATVQQDKSGGKSSAYAQGINAIVNIIRVLKCQEKVIS